MPRSPIALAAAVALLAPSACGVTSEGAPGIGAPVATARPSPLGGPVPSSGDPADVGPLGIFAGPRRETEASAEARSGSSRPPSRCNEQTPQDFLIRGSYLVVPGTGREEAARRRAVHARAIEYRTRQYGYVEGFGQPAWNRLEPTHYVKAGRFFGVRVSMNVRVLDALACVEQAITAECAASPYAPRVLDGLRTRNTFHNDEVSNHLYGIAIDIDPDKNSCCGCVPPLSEWPRCKKVVSSPFERAAIPRCWVESFERFGFYWLGHDVLEDTMHFEFLGDPSKIRRGVEPPPQ